MVLWQVLDVLHTVPACPPSHLDGVPVLRVHAAEQTKDHTQPERAILLEVHFTIVIHRVRGASEVEGVFVRVHVGFELNGILRGHCLRIRMVKIQEVVHLWLVELSWIAHCSSSDWASALPRNTAFVVPEMIHIVLFALLFQFTKTRLGVAAWSGRSHRDITRLVSGIDVVSFCELTLIDFSECFRVL